MAEYIFVQKMWRRYESEITIGTLLLILRIDRLGKRYSYCLDFKDSKDKADSYALS